MIEKIDSYIRFKFSRDFFLFEVKSQAIRVRNDGEIVHFEFGEFID